MNIPPRTRVTISIWIDPTQGTTERTIVEYECLDCGFRTRTYEEMMDHQTHFKHSPLIRLKRFFNILFGR